MPSNANTLLNISNKVMNILGVMDMFGGLARDYTKHALFSNIQQHSAKSFDKIKGDIILFHELSSTKSLFNNYNQTVSVFRKYRYILMSCVFVIGVVCTMLIFSSRSMNTRTTIEYTHDIVGKFYKEYTEFCKGMHACIITEHNKEHNVQYMRFKFCEKVFKNRQYDHLTYFVKDIDTKDTVNNIVNKAIQNIKQHNYTQTENKTISDIIFSLVILSYFNKHVNINDTRVNNIMNIIESTKSNINK